VSEQIEQGTSYVASLRAIALGELSLNALLQSAAALTEAGQSVQATNLYRAWIKTNADSPMRHVALFNCAVLESVAGNYAAAIQTLSAAIAAEPNFLPAYINLGAAYEKSGDAPKAIETWRTGTTRPITAGPSQVGYIATLYKQIARVYGDQMMPDMAEQAVAQCLILGPQHKDAMEQYVAFRLAQCKWPSVEPIEQVDQTMMIKSMHPLSAAVYSDDPLLQLATAERYVRETVSKTAEPGPIDRRAAAIDLSGRRLRIGYVSSDLRDHAVGYLMAELFECHDRNAVEVFAYYCGIPSDSDLTKRTKLAIEHWREIRNLSNEAAAALIAQDGIDILVDVNGHTRDAKLGIFALRPAPIQVNWLGFPGTMGSPFHHYIIADDWIIPPGSEKYYSERVLRLPCYQPNDRRREVGPVPARATYGLPDNAFVYCCFNGTHKISRFAFERWMTIMRAVPGSVLWLLDAQASVQDRIRKSAADLGVAAERIVFAPRIKNSMHLARYALADVFLDTAPYGAHTTASDALWMGVPVVTFSGRGFASRVCGGLVRAAGTPELVGDTPEAYVEIAIALGQNPASAKALRRRLLANRATSVLFDTDLLTQKLEGLYREMVLEHQGGALPKPDLSNLDAYLDIGARLPHEVSEMTAAHDYEGIYLSALASRHAMRPIQADRRLWTQDAIEAAERDFARKLASRIHPAAAAKDVATFKRTA
jgi:predicted O-linked N-acetylglucosamine transferase (SPINDLY family)